MDLQESKFKIAEVPQELVVSEDKDAFKPDQPEDLPQVNVANLPEDATHLSPEELQQVPTLTESITPQQEQSLEGGMVEALTEQIASETQELPEKTESWLDVCQKRVVHLADEIHQLNDRLDRLEKRLKV